MIVPVNVGDAERTILPVPVEAVSPRTPPLSYRYLPEVELRTVVVPTVIPETVADGSRPSIVPTPECSVRSSGT